MKRVAILGPSGMLGGKMMTACRNAGFNVAGFGRPEFDAECPDFKKISGYDYVINCIGIIKPYIHDDDSASVMRAIRVNAEFPHRLAQLDARIIQIATDCVWDGKCGNYAEDTPHNATDVYGQTKSLGEVVADNFLNLRCSIIGFETKSYLSLLEWFLRMPRGAHVNGFKNHLWNGLTTDAFADICIGIIRQDAWFAGTAHVIPADIMSKARMLHQFAAQFGRMDINISDIDAPIAINRTIVTNNSARNEKLWRDAGYVHIPTIADMIRSMSR